MISLACYDIETSTTNHKRLNKIIDTALPIVKIESIFKKVGVDVGD